MNTSRLPFACFAALTLSCFPLVDGAPRNLAGRQLRFTFLHTSDIHSRLLPYDFAPTRTDTDLGIIPEAGPFGGVARLGALIKRERANADRLLHIDSGDSFQGAPIFNVNSGEVEYKFLSRIRLDAAVIGNHEFDAGPLNFTLQAKNNATFPVLAANYNWDDYRQLDSNQTQLVTEPYTIRVVDGVRVGIIGMANISSLNSLVEGGNSLQATPLEQNEAARGWVEFLKPVTDLIVVTSHLGLTEDQDLVRGYEAYFEYGKAKSYITRASNPWKVLEWFGDEGLDASVVRVLIPGVSGIDLILGGHLHVILNPPQILTDPSGRKVLLAHGGAFAKYLGRVDTVIQMPAEPGTGEGAEILSHTYRVFPVDGLWCSDALHAYYKEKFWAAGQFIKDPQVQAGLAECTQKEDANVTQLLQPYVVNLDFALNLTSLFGYAPRDIARRNNSTGGDSPLGNMATDSMRKRRRVEAEFAVTNSLGIRDNLYAGPLTQEGMFNVFPFENTINIMYLSGVEMQEMFDFITERSSGRGCISQSQISGGRFTMDCAQVQLNDLRFSCDPSKTGDANGSDCPGQDRTGRAPWRCVDDINGGGRCWAHTGTNIEINGKALDPYATYRIAVNDYIAKGGSGFSVLKRNTTRIETGIPLRDSLIGYIQAFCSCDDVLANKTDAAGHVIGKNGQLCGALQGGAWSVDSQEVSFCRRADEFKRALGRVVGRCTCADILAHSPACGFIGDLTEQRQQFEAARTQCETAPDAQTPALNEGPGLGRCTCRDALWGDPSCGNVTRAVKNFCLNPTTIAIAVGVEDGRIIRRVK